MGKSVRVTDLKFIVIYVDKLASCQAFYETYFGFEKTAEFGPGEIFGTVGDVNLWMGEGYTRSTNDEQFTRASIMIGVDSTGTLFENLKADGHKIIQDAPVEMQEGTFWMQIVDPAGNVLDILGGK